MKRTVCLDEYLRDVISQTLCLLTTNPQSSVKFAYITDLLCFCFAGYAPFQSMTVRESFLTVGEQLAAAPGPGHYSPSLRLRNAQGASSLKNRVISLA